MIDVAPIGQEDGAINKTIGYHRDQSNFFELFRINSQGNLSNLKIKINESKEKVKYPLMETKCSVM